MCNKSITEVWKPIKGYESLYEVSNLGRVKSIKRSIFLKLKKDKCGYMCVILCTDGIHKFHLVHRLVAETFIKNPLNKPVINHIDCNPSNNRVDNLEWCTQQENLQYASKLGRLNKPHKPHKPHKPRKGKPIIATNLQTGEEIYFKSQCEAGKQLKLKPASIQDVLKNRRKQMKSYTFKYAEQETNN